MGNSTIFVRTSEKNEYVSARLVYFAIRAITTAMLYCTVKYNCLHFLLFGMQRPWCPLPVDSYVTLYFLKQHGNRVDYVGVAAIEY